MKKPFVILTLLSLIVIVGCIPFSQTSEEETKGICPSLCFGGTDGVNTIIDVPDRVLASFGFTPRFEVENLGEHREVEGNLLIAGLDPNLFGQYGGCSSPISFRITDDPDDDLHYKREIISDLSAASLDVERSLSQTMTVYTRYGYTTYGVYDLFLTGNPQDERNAIEGNKLKVSSGAPVEITSVTEEIFSSGGQIQLRLLIEAEANLRPEQQLIEKGDVDSGSCVLPEDDLFIDADVRVVLFEQPWGCTPMRFEDGRGEAESTCIIDPIDTSRFIGDQNDWPGWVELSYGFQEIKSFDFTVVEG